MKITVTIQQEPRKGRDLTKDEIQKIKDYYQKLKAGMPVPKKILG
jgi:hypothetical protein